MPFEIGNIPAEKRRGWTVKIDGEERAVGLIEIESPNFGKLAYGLRPEGYDGWTFTEAGTGGTITVPYVLHPEYGLLVGLIMEHRANMGGKVYCGIGGFKDPDESHDASAGREASEESDLVAPLVRLKGLGVNANRAFFVAEVAASEGVRCYKMKLDESIITKEIPDGEYAETEWNGQWTVNPGPHMQGHKKVSAIRLMPWKAAVRGCADALALAAIAQLAAEVLP